MNSPAMASCTKEGIITSNSIRSKRVKTAQSEIDALRQKQTEKLYNEVNSPNISSTIYKESRRAVIRTKNGRLSSNILRYHETQFDHPFPPLGGVGGPVRRIRHRRTRSIAGKAR